jgi:tripartite-type tricarboxylate transporter receptor subunit TctC
MVQSWSAGVALAQAYPAKAIRVVTGSTGGGNDFTMRLLAPVLSGILGQQVVVENRGGSAILPAQAVLQAPADGYTLLFFNDGMWALPLMQKAPYDPLKSFVPVVLATSSPNMLVVHPSLPVRSVKDLIALARKRPGEINYASGGTGSSNHLAAELFKSAARVNLVRVAYKGSGPALTGVMSGEVHSMFPNAAGAAPHVKASRLRALAITTEQPSALFPELPTVAQFVPGYESATSFALFAPAGTPSNVIARLNEAFVDALQRAEVKQRLSNDGQQVVGSTPDQLAAKVRAETARLEKVIPKAGISSE